MVQVYKAMKRIHSILILCFLFSGVVVNSQNTTSYETTPVTSVISANTTTAITTTTTTSATTAITTTTTTSATTATTATTTTEKPTNTNSTTKPKTSTFISTTDDTTSQTSMSNSTIEASTAATETTAVTEPTSVATTITDSNFTSIVPSNNTTAAENITNTTPSTAPTTSSEATTSSAAAATTATTTIISTPPSTTSSTPSSTTSSTTSSTASTTLVTTAIATTASSSPDGTTDTVLIAVLVCFSLVLIIFLIALFYYCRGNEKLCGNRDDVEAIPLRPNQPNNKVKDRKSVYLKANKFIVGQMNIAKDHFEKDYQKKCGDDNRLFRMEYLALPAGDLPVTESRRVENAVKNRYDNILPYDSSRVLLQNSPESGRTDYINANFVSGFQCSKKWIASQGPKNETFNDFWQMIWEQNCYTVIMITNLVENGKLKCHKYWPGGQGPEGQFPDTENYGEFTVTLKEESQRNFYVLRVFDVKYNDESNRTVKQFHYTAWPDFGVPGNASNLLHFRRRVIASQPETAGPIVIHCSAGVGRTGTFIAIDAAIRQIDEEGQADIFSYVSHIREERMKLIQTDIQYAFVHKAVVEYIKFGVTELPVKEFFQKVKSLRKKFDEGDETVFESEFQKLVKLPLLKDCMKHGKGNLKKNRLLQIIPYDFNRVLLPRKPGQEKSDYINASFVDGFKKKGRFIVTQGPMQDTLSDFWIMILQNRVQNIVMLTKLEEKGLTASAQYWPETEEEEATFGDVRVKLKSEENVQDYCYVLRNFTITHSQNPEKLFHVTQYHYMGWPDVGQGEPTSSQDIFQILNKLTGSENSPIVIHCSSGGGRSGVFCCLSTLMDQIQEDGVIDVFQTVRHLREQRPHLIQSQDQYNFCYWSILEHLSLTLDDMDDFETDISQNGAVASTNFALTLDSDENDEITKEADKKEETSDKEEPDEEEETSDKEETEQQNNSLVENTPVKSEQENCSGDDQSDQDNDEKDVNEKDDEAESKNDQPVLV